MEQLLLNISLDAKTVKNVLKNEKLLQTLKSMLEENNIQSADKKTGNFYYDIAGKAPQSITKYLVILTKYVKEKQIDSKEKLEQSIDYLTKNAGTSELNIQQFEKASGVNFDTSDQAIQTAMKNFLETRKEHILQERYHVNMAEFKKVNVFFPGGSIKKTLDQELESMLGPKTEADKQKKVVVKEPKEKKTESKKEQDDEEKTSNLQECIKDITNFQGRMIESLVNSDELLKKHKDATNGAIVTRFPPEPNGYLHIGHAKAMRFSFSVAKAHNGYTNLRFDDTNPEKENQEFIDSIKENVKWLGYTPKQVTTSSSNFEFIYKQAVKLIQKGKAYVCAQTKDEIKHSRQNLLPSQFRDRSIQDNQRLFEEMRMGLHDEGSLSLRLKIDHTHQNPTLRDPHIFRIRYTDHPHAGNKWCIYPLYDFTHCMCDSIENVTHSFCSLEFEIRRELYYWILKELDMYRPMVWEFSRLNIRKLHQLIVEGYVNGWDDPRLFTLDGMKRRGYSPDVINEFCDQLGMTRRGNDNIIPMHFLENIVRKNLDANSPRRLGVIDPVKLTITNLKENKIVQAFHFPHKPEMGSYDLTVSKTLYVEREDVIEKERKDHYGFAPGKITGLKYIGVFKTSEVKVINGQISEVLVELLENSTEKPKSYLHWISSLDSVDCQINLYDTLFSEHNPQSLENYLTGINKESLVIYTNSKVNKNIINCDFQFRVQFERVGFFIKDKDSSNKHLIFNRIVGLQDRSKSKAPKK